MCTTLNPDPNDPNRFTGLYNPSNGLPPETIAGAYIPLYGEFSLDWYLSLSVEGEPTPGYVVTIDATDWPQSLRPSAVQVYLKDDACWAVLNIA